ncbi:cardiolipin synthase B, partial [Streptomyces sp. NPDC001822]
MSIRTDEKPVDERPDGRWDAGTAERTQRLRRRLERLIGIAATEGNEVVPLRNGDEIFAAML